jgi:hypothetical protein
MFALNDTAHALPASDGHPLAWFTPNWTQTGLSITIDTMYAFICQTLSNSVNGVDS